MASFARLRAPRLHSSTSAQHQSRLEKTIKAPGKNMPNLSSSLTTNRSLVDMEAQRLNDGRDLSLHQNPTYIEPDY
jgi:hypothetical protein